jgi:hypothetical protein
MVSYPVVGWPDVVTAQQANELDVLLDTRRDDECASCGVSRNKRSSVP